MVWHDCKTDPPKKSGRYILFYKDIVYDKLRWDAIHYSFNTKEWTDGFFRTFDCPIKWTEVDLSEVD